MELKKAQKAKELLDLIKNVDKEIDNVTNNPVKNIHYMEFTGDKQKDGNTLRIILGSKLAEFIGFPVTHDEMLNFLTETRNKITKALEEL